MVYATHITVARRRKKFGEQEEFLSGGKRNQERLALRALEKRRAEPAALNRAARRRAAWAVPKHNQDEERLTRTQTHDMRKRVSEGLKPDEAREA
jgi:hypothetical protein